MRPDAGEVATNPETGACGCPGPSRRGFLGGMGLLGATAALGGVTALGSDVVSPRYSFAADSSYTGDVLVVLSLRGGFDGLSAVVPAADPHYRAARPGIGIPAGQLIPLDATFGLHPALAPLQPLWEAGTLAVVHAAGHPQPTRSHFAAMQEVERAAPGSSLRTGWLDRVSGAHGAGTAFATVGLGGSSPSQALLGPAPELVVRSLQDFSLAGDDNGRDRARWFAALRRMHSGARPELRGPATTTLAALDVVATLQNSAPAAGVTYPDGPLGEALRDVARLVKAHVGLRVATVDEGDWDMHVGLGRSDDGWMARQLREIGESLAAFARDLGEDQQRVTLVTLSEFGRRVEENASGGLDHGYGNLMLLMGGGIVGGRVHGHWPGLAPDSLVDGDLAAPNDYRAVLAEVLEKRCGVTGSSVFPGLSSARFGVAR